MVESFPVAIVGVGKIARDQHLPAIEANPDFRLVAAVSRNDAVAGIPNFTSFDQFLAEGPAAAVSLCVPPSVRTPMALKALAAGRDVLLEKPPAATLGEIDHMLAAARAAGACLFATWHSRFGPAVAPAKAWLAGRRVLSVRILWCEDVRRWHPGQDWIWQPGGFGAFDPGINALSILTEILPGPFLLDRARLMFPANRDMPIAAELEMTVPGGYPVTMDLDWRGVRPQRWDILVETDAGLLEVTEGGAVLRLDGTEVSRAAEREYPEIYRHFAGLLRARTIDVDASPLRIVADAFLLGQRITVDAYDD